jgi:hypothetical protein
MYSPVKERESEPLRHFCIDLDLTQAQFWLLVDVRLADLRAGISYECTKLPPKTIEFIGVYWEMSEITVCHSGDSRPHGCIQLE